MIRGLLAFIKNKKTLLDLLTKTDEFLHPGVYAFDNSLSYIYLKDGWSHNRARELFGTDKRLIRRLILYIVKVLFFRKNILIAHDNNTTDIHRDIKGTVCSLGVYRKSLKIFDFTNNKVITIFLDAAEFNATINNYLYFKPYFPLTEILDYNQQEFVILEEFFTAKPVKQWSNDDYTYVINDV